jgi:DNA-binding PadR family transcriptional regulator
LISNAKSLQSVKSILNIEPLLINVRGFFKDLVLYAVAKLGKAYGYAIKKFIFQNIRIYAPSSGILYPTLHELEKEGLLRSSIEGKKKVYMLTEKGYEHLATRIEHVEKIVERINRAIEIMEYIGFKELLEILKKLWELEVEPPKHVLDAIRIRITEINSMLNSLLNSKQISNQLLSQSSSPRQTSTQL